MKFVLAELKEGVPIKLEQKVDSSSWDVEYDDFKYPKELEISMVVEKGADSLTIHGNVGGERICVCGRCLKEHVIEFSEKFDLYYATEGETIIDATPQLREQLLLDRTIAFHCPDGCYGLCPKCGSELNKEGCQNPQCSSQSVKESPFSSLKEKWEKKK